MWASWKSRGPDRLGGSGQIEALEILIKWEGEARALELETLRELCNLGRSRLCSSLGL